MLVHRFNRVKDNMVRCSNGALVGECREEQNGARCIVMKDNAVKCSICASTVHQLCINSNGAVLEHCMGRYIGEQRIVKVTQTDRG